MIAFGLKGAVRNASSERRHHLLHIFVWRCSHYKERKVSGAIKPYDSIT